MLSAIRYTFAESGTSFDELLGGVIMDFLALLTDADLVSTIWNNGDAGLIIIYCRLFVVWPCRH